MPITQALGIGRPADPEVHWLARLAEPVSVDSFGHLSEKTLEGAQRPST